MRIAPKLVALSGLALASCLDFQTTYEVCRDAGRCGDSLAAAGGGRSADGGDAGRGDEGSCGDRVLSGPEACDDGNVVSGDGCGSMCTVDFGWACPTVGVACVAASCGDGKLAGFEECDDGNTTAGDGCSATCVTEEGFACPTAATACHSTVCGDKNSSGGCAPGDFCNSLEECVPSFPYVPSNFTERQLDEVPSTIRVEIVSPTTINTQTEDGGVEARLEGGGVLDLPFEVIAQGGTGPQAVVLHARSIHVADAGLLTVEGARPLIIAVREDANINGTIITRAGADIDCAPPESADYDFDGESQGGGGGGGFGKRGGGGANSSTYASVGQGTSGAESLVPLRGGCRGGTGGPDGTADGGLGGGAVQLSAARDVFVNGTVAAPGRGGRGAPTKLDGGGGGGGGSGGGLLIEGRRIVLGGLARLTANGGGGGQGASTHEGSCGSPGEDGLTDGEKNASGGTKGMGSSGCAGEGGQGGSRLSAAGQGALPGDCTPYVGGGGGGGGAVGRIRLKASTECAREDGGVVSPPATGSGSGC